MKEQRGSMELRSVQITLHPNNDAAHWDIGETRWRVERQRARWTLYRCGADVELREGRFRALDDAVSYSLGWCRGLMSARYCFATVVETVLGEQFITREEAMDAGIKGGDQ